MHTSDLKRLTGAYSDRNDTVEPNVRRGQEKPQFAPGAAMYDVFGRKDAKFPFRFDQRAGPFLHTKMAGLVLTDDPDYALQERVNKRRVLSLFDCGENAMLWHLSSLFHSRSSPTAPEPLPVPDACTEASYPATVALRMAQIQPEFTLSSLNSRSLGLIRLLTLGRDAKIESSGAAGHSWETLHGPPDGMRKQMRKTVDAGVWGAITTQR